MIYDDGPLKKIDPDVTEKFEKLLTKEELLIRSEFQDQLKATEQVKWSMIFSVCLILVGTIGLMVTGVLLLGSFLEWWKASFIITLIFLSIGGFLYGMKKEKEIASGNYPKHSLDTLNEMRNYLHDESLTQH